MEDDMSYFDGFLISVPNGKKQEYIEIAKTAAPIFLEFGALRVIETWGDNLPHGKVTDFYMAVKAEADDGIVMSYIEWPDKETRDIGNDKVMKDPRMPDFDKIPFNAKTMIFGGFELLLDEKS